MATNRLASPAVTPSNSISLNLASRVRSASPSRRALAIDMRRIASLLRDPPIGANDCPHSVNTSICSSPQSAWEPGDRGAAPIGANSAATRAAINSSLSALSQKVDSAIADLQRKLDTDRKRLTLVERKLDTRNDDRTRESDGRERWAELQGSVHGLLDETQTLNRRIEEIDQRLWARTSGSEIVKQRNKELEQQVQALEKNRLATAAIEETQKRQGTKIRRTEQTIEELTRRVAKAEEDTRIRQGQGSTQAYAEQRFEQRFVGLEQLLEQMGLDIHHLQGQIDDGFQAIGENQIDDENSADVAARGVLQEAVQSAERGLSSLEKKLSVQLEELASSVASLRVKVDGQSNRVLSISERLESAHEPAIESIRAEMGQARSQDRRELEGELASLRAKVDDVLDNSDDPQAEVREALRQVQAEVSAIKLRPDDNLLLMNLDERLANQDRDINDLHALLDSIPRSDSPLDGEEEKLPDEWEDVKRRIEWLEEQVATGSAAEQADQKQVSQVQKTLYDVLEQVSNIKQKQSSSEASSSSVQQQVQSLQTLIERRSTDDPASVRLVTEVEAKVAAISHQVVQVEARLLEVEGGLEFARENDTIPGVEVSAVSMASEMVSNQRALPPLPRGEVERGGSTGDLSPAMLKEQLEAVACSLEALDELAERVAILESRGSLGLAEGGSAERTISDDQISFGPPPATVNAVPDALVKDVENTAQQVNDVRGRLMAVERSLETLERKSTPPSNDNANAEVKGLTTRMDNVEADISGNMQSLDLDRSRLKSLEEGREDTLERLTRLEASAIARSPTASMTAVAVNDVDSELRPKLNSLSDRVDAETAKRSTFESCINDALAKQKEVAESGMNELRENFKTLRETAGQSSEHSALKSQVEELAQKFNGFQGEWITKNELSGKLDKLSAQHDESIAKLESNVTLASSGIDEIRAEIATVRGDASNKVMPEDLVKLREDVEKVQADKTASIDVSDLAARVKQTESNIEALREGPKKIEEDLMTLREAIEKVEATKCSSTDVSDLAARVKQTETNIEALREVPKKIEDVAAKSGLHEALSKRLVAVEELPASVEKLRSEVNCLSTSMQAAESKLKELPLKSTEEAERLRQLSGLGQRMKAMEDRLESRPPPSPSGSPSAASVADERARTQIQTMVEELRTKVLDELGSLGEHQAELANAKASLQTLAKKAPGDGSSHSGDNSPVIAGLRRDIQQLQESRSDANSNAVLTQVSELKQQFAELQGKLKDPQGSSVPVRKVGISSAMTEDIASSPLAVVMQNKLDALTEQVADLQSQVSKSPSKSGDNVPKDASLNFSLTEDATERLGGGSLNFSLTEQSQQLGGGSLNFSLTEQSQQDDALSKMLSSGTSKGVGDVHDAPSSGRPRPPALSLDESQSGTGGLLPSVMEEEELGDVAADDMASRGGSRSGSGSRIGTSVTPKSTKSALESPSGHEVSVGFDISVEDSLQLEDECDFVETVQPFPTASVRNDDRKSPANVSVGSASSKSQEKEGQQPKASESDALDTLMNSPPSSKSSNKSPASSSKSPLGTSVNSATSPAGKSPLATSAAVGAKPSLSLPLESKQVVGLAAATSPAPQTANRTSLSPPSKDDDKYGEESFDDMSVAESIEESIEHSTSWGNEEDA